MLIRLMSDQFSFVDGYIGALAGGPPNLQVSGAQLRDGAADIADLRPGPVTLMIRDCLVICREALMERRLPSFILTTEITKDDMQQDALNVSLGPHAFARIAVRGASPEGGPHLVGIVLDYATMETPVNREGYVDVLLPAGDHLVYLHHSPEIRASVSVLPNQHNAGTITLPS